MSRRCRIWIKRTLLLTLPTGFAILCTGAAIPAPVSRSAAYSFTAAQAAQGKVLYSDHCAACHGARLEGAGAPSLAGKGFAARWMHGDRTFDNLTLALHRMPLQAPGSLSDDDYAALMAYILSASGFEPGKAATQATGSNQVIQPLPTTFSEAASAAPPTSLEAGAGAPEQSLPAPPKTVAAALANLPTDAQLLTGSATDWLMYNRTYSGDRFSPLTQIDIGNAKELQAVCNLQLGVLGSLQSSPLIYNGTGFISSTYGVYAFDAATCDRKWSYIYAPEGSEGFPTNRGIALYDGKIFRGTPDAHLLAIDAITGSLLWNVHVADSALGYSIGAAPIVVGGKVIVGLAGGDWGVSGHVYAFDARTGAKVWSFDTIKKEDWPKGASLGGGATWTTVTVDPKNNLVYIPVGNPVPLFNPGVRPGANPYTNSIVALDLGTGRVSWSVQQIASDEHDWDTAAAPVLYKQDGRRYMAVGTKGGFLYIYDLDSHRLLSRTTIVPRLNDETKLTEKPLHVCPGGLSGVEWNGPAYDPLTKSILVNAIDWCYTLSSKLEGKQPGMLYLDGKVQMDPPETSSGWTRAFDAATGVERWARHEPRPMIGGITPTAGGVVLTGGSDGHFLVLDSRDGKQLYSFNVGGSIGGGVSTYMVGGRQFVAVASGGHGLGIYGVAGAPSLTVFALPPVLH